MTGFTAEDFDRLADPTVGAGSLDPLPCADPYCGDCFASLAECQCRPDDDMTAVEHLRVIVAALRALHFPDPVPAPLASVINAAGSYLRHHHPEE